MGSYSLIGLLAIAAAIGLINCLLTQGKAAEELCKAADQKKDERNYQTVMHEVGSLDKGDENKFKVTFKLECEKNKNKITFCFLMCDDNPNIKECGLYDGAVKAIKAATGMLSMAKSFTLQPTGTGYYITCKATGPPLITANPM